MEYDSDTARHYAAYRPPLHGRLLGQCLAGHFAQGLDVGCGTGHSARALRTFCDRVVAIDPSAAMLREAAAEPGITYLQQRSGGLDFPDRSFDVVTFAGSLYYARSQALLDEVVRVCRPGARVVVYDFSAPLRTDCAARLGLPEARALPGDYDLTTTFDGLHAPSLRKLTTTAGSQEVRVDAPELSSLYLSDPGLAELLATRFGEGDLPGRVARAVAAITAGSGARIPVVFQTVSTVYERVGEGADGKPA